MKRTSIKIVGESGMGLLSTGDIIIKSLKKRGLFVHADREYPSLIKGGHSTYQIDFSDEPIHSLVSETDIMIAMDEPGLQAALPTLKRGGIVIFGHERHHLMGFLKKDIAERGTQLVYIPARDISYGHGGNALMTNMVLLGLLWKILDFDLHNLEEEVSDRFASKPKLLAIDLECLKSGFAAEKVEAELPTVDTPTADSVPEKIVIGGNYAIALGAIQAGVRTYYAYPMSPSSTILSYIAKTYHHSGMVVKQAEDEITAAQMAMGSMHTGSRSLVATSGGGFDLMTETVSGAAITETPLVIVIAQRPGPGTGLPTWTCQGDLNLAIHSAHGEFPRAVLACSDPTSAYELTQHALNIAEEFQIPVILLTEKYVAEAQMTVDHFEHGKIPIKRGLVQDTKELEELSPSDRFAITESGISKRWLPGTSQAHYFANADEHWTNGAIAEDSERVIPMMDKRMRKEKLLKESLPDPEIFGLEGGADLSFIGWGSSKNVIRDLITIAEKQGKTVNYLHYEYMWPFREEKAKKFFADNKNVHLIEGNFRGQLGDIVEAHTGERFANRLLKYDGRLFYIDELISYLKEHA